VYFEPETFVLDAALSAGVEALAPAQGDPFYELDWVFLHEHPHILERHWETAWREGRV
jgi:hypothetical protein